MPESSHSANWVVVTPIPVACWGWGDFRENHVGLCVWHNPLEITSDWNTREATPSFHLQDTCGLESSAGRCKGTVIKNKRESWFFFPSSFFTKVHLQAGTWVGSQSSYFFFASYFDSPWHYLFSFFFFPGKFSLPRYFIIHVLLFSLRCWTVSKQKCLKWSFILKTLFYSFLLPWWVFSGGLLWIICDFNELWLDKTLSSYNKY